MILIEKNPSLVGNDLINFISLYIFYSLYMYGIFEHLINERNADFTYITLHTSVQKRTWCLCIKINFISASHFTRPTIHLNPLNPSLRCVPERLYINKLTLLYLRVFAIYLVSEAVTFKKQFSSKFYINMLRRFVSLHKTSLVSVNVCYSQSTEGHLSKKCPTLTGFLSVILL